jgi:hypothetical protein
MEVIFAVFIVSQIFIDIMVMYTLNVHTSMIRVTNNSIEHLTNAVSTLAQIFKGIAD